MIQSIELSRLPVSDGMPKEDPATRSTTAAARIRSSRGSEVPEPEPLHREAGVHEQHEDGADPAGDDDRLDPGGVVRHRQAARAHAEQRVLVQHQLAQLEQATGLDHGLAVLGDRHRTRHPRRRPPEPKRPELIV